METRSKLTNVSKHISPSTRIWSTYVSILTLNLITFCRNPLVTLPDDSYPVLITSFSLQSNKEKKKMMKILVRQLIPRGYVKKKVGFMKWKIWTLYQVILTGTNGIINLLGIPRWIPPGLSRFFLMKWPRGFLIRFRRIDHSLSIYDDLEANSEASKLGAVCALGFGSNAN